jgi:hypothetical protein
VAVRRVAEAVKKRTNTRETRRRKEGKYNAVRTVKLATMSMESRSMLATGTQEDPDQVP